jgi:hypothetical protein
MMDDDECGVVVEWMPGETEVLEGNISQCRFVHHKYHITLYGLEQGRRDVNQATNRMSYGTA